MGLNEMAKMRVVFEPFIMFLFFESLIPIDKIKSNNNYKYLHERIKFISFNNYRVHKQESFVTSS